MLHQARSAFSIAPTPTTFYLRTLVMSYRTTQGAANTVVGATAEIRVTKAPIEVAADEGEA